MAAFSDARHDAGLDKPGAYGGARNGAADAGRAAAQAQQNAIMGMGPAPSGPPSAGPSPTFTRNQGVTGPRPGTQDRWGTTVGQDPDIQKQQSDYNSAADAMANRGFGGWIEDHLKDLVPGFHQVTPEWNQPASYSGGNYHDAWSTLGAVLGVAGTAAPIPGAGMLMSKLGIGATDAMGLPDYKFGGGGWNPSTANPIEKAMGPAGPMGAADPSKSPNLGNPTQGGQQPQIPGPGKTVSIFNPQPQQQPQQAPLPPIFAPLPPISSRYQVPGGLPYGIDLFRRAAA